MPAGNWKTSRPEGLRGDPVRVNRIRPPALVRCRRAGDTHLPLKRCPVPAWNVHGHTHGAEPPIRRHVNVSVERTDYRPLRLAELIRKLSRWPKVARTGPGRGGRARGLQPTGHRVGPTNRDGVAVDGASAKQLATTRAAVEPQTCGTPPRPKPRPGGREIAAGDELAVALGPGPV